jgi:hypothetical protein
MLSWFDQIHYLTVAEDGGNWHKSAREGFAQQDDIGTDTFMVHAEKLSCAAQSSLDFIADEEYTIFAADLPAFLQVSGRRYYNSLLSLDRLNHKSHHVRIGLDRLFQSCSTSVVDESEVKTLERPEITVTIGVIGTSAGSDSPAPEVTLSEENGGLVSRDSLNGITPPPGELDGTLPCLHAGVHEERLLVAEDLVHFELSRPQEVVVDSPRGEGEFLGLVEEGLEDAGVQVALVDCRVGGEEVDVALACVGRGVPSQSVA